MDRWIDGWIDKLKQGYNYLNDEEKQIAQAHFQNVFQMIATEYRLGRLDRNPLYTHFSLRDKAMMGEFKAMRDLFKVMFITNLKNKFKLGF